MIHGISEHFVWNKVDVLRNSSLLGTSSRKKWLIGKYFCAQICCPVLIYGITLKVVVVCRQDLKSQEPVTLDFLDAELEDEEKVKVRAEWLWLCRTCKKKNEFVNTMKVNRVQNNAGPNWLSFNWQKHFSRIILYPIKFKSAFRFKISCIKMNTGWCDFVL